MIKKCIFSNKEDFSTLKGIISLQGNFYLAAVIHSLRSEQRYPFGKKFLSLIVKLDLDFYQEFFRSTGLLVCTWLVLAMIQEIPQQVR